MRQATSADVEFAYSVTESAMRSYVEQTWGVWEPDAQREHVRRSFILETHSVILVEGKPVGIVAIEETLTHVQLEKLYLLPEVRNRGIGSELLVHLLERARQRAVPVRLGVLRVNASAQRFYARHGFVVVESTPERLFMAAGT